MLADQLGTVDAGGTFATAIFDALEAAKDAAGEADASDPTAANKKLADLLAVAVYDFLIKATVSTTVTADVQTETECVVAAGTGAAGTGEGGAGSKNVSGEHDLSGLNGDGTGGLS